ncbi:MAG TPA: hypothetical protein VN317_03400 [Candidatus Methanoperedens sp.]|nr:hypothetical protein [Candidatus Methanoperedens sp.]
MPDVRRYRIGGFTLTVTSPAAPLIDERNPEYLPFLAPHRDCNGSGGGSDIAVEARLGEPSLPAGACPLMEGGEAWAAFERDGALFIAPHVEPPAPRPEWLAEVHPGRRRVTLCCGEALLTGAGDERRLAAPFHYPLDQILLSLVLAGEALIVHAAGVDVNGRGVLLAGASGAGKTTIAGICAAAGHAVLSDDRVLVRHSPGEWTLHGTPWPGEGRFAENRGVPLSAVAFLAQGGANLLAPLPPRALARRLLPLATVPWFDTAARERSLDLLAALATAVPVFEFTFRPDPGAARVLAAAIPPATG